MKKKLAKILICLSLLFFLLSAISYLFIKGYKATPTFGFGEIKKVKNCTGYGVCSLDDPAEFRMITLNFDNEVVQKEIQKINDNTLKFYKRQKKSNLDGGLCTEEARKTYYHSLEIYSITDKIVNDDYIACSVIRLVRDVCSGKAEKNEPDVMIYDYKKKKLLSQEEFKAQENITDEMIYQAIQATIDYLNKGSNGMQYEFKDVDMDSLKLYYGRDGQAHVIFFHNVFGSYNTGLIVKKDK